MTDPHGAPAPLDDDPRTPAWLPALGAALFIAAAALWAASSWESKPAAPPATPSSSAHLPTPASAGGVGEPVHLALPAGTH